MNIHGIFKTVSTSAVGILKTVSTSAVKHSPEILTAAGTIGLVVAGIIAVKETPKAIKIKEEYESRVDTEEPITLVDEIKICWKVYLPSVLIGTLSIVSIIFARRLDAKRMAAWAAAYQISETSINRLEQSIKDEYGEKKLKKMQDKADLKVMEEHPIVPDQIIDTGDGDDLFCDYYSGHYFRSSVNAINGRYNNFIAKLNREDYLTPNDWLYFLSIPRMGEDVGDNSYFTSKQFQSGELWEEPVYIYGPGINDKPCAVVKLSCKPLNEY